MSGFGGPGLRRVEGRPLGDVADVELVERARGGDVLAYGELVDRYRAIAFRTAYLIARDTGEAEDAAQEAFVKAYYALDRFRSDAPFRPWLLRIVANEAKNRVRASGRRERLSLRAAAQPGEAAPSPEAAALEGERNRALLAALDRLRPADREILTCRFLLDLSEAETAEALGIRRGTVKSRTARALGRLRARLPEVLLSTDRMEAIHG
ncbi:MAG TPA: sigma-70 family RNA polymerase sigma factor [Actinomycetota bacterium]|nr:sigma-70 family RNA polymerase sigma factor [Actinomycetota bacterium]